jgi:DNA-binding transcriptional LysR family regulator
MDTDLLRTFIEVSKTRHFGRAAENLYLTQSAVSFRIRQLEQQLGVSLFTRYRNNIQLTPSGENLLPYAESILVTLKQAKQAIVKEGPQLQTVSVGAPQLYWELGLQQWLDGWLCAQPGLALRQETGNREYLSRQLLDRNLDLAVLAEPSKLDEIILLHLTDVQLCLVSTQANLALAQLAELPLVWVDWLPGINSQLYPPELAIRTPVLHTASIQSALFHLQRHGGISLLPRTMISPQINRNELFFVDGFTPVNRPLYVACREETSQLPIIQDLLQRPIHFGTQQI